MKCPQCKKELPDGAAYCHGCGSRILAKPTEEETPSPSEPDADKSVTPEKPRKKRRAGRIALGVFGVLLLLAAIITPTALAISFWQDVEWYCAQRDKERRDFARREKEIRENALADLKEWFTDAEWNDDGSIYKIRGVFGWKLGDTKNSSEGLSNGPWSVEFRRTAKTKKIFQIRAEMTTSTHSREYSNIVKRFKELFDKKPIESDVSRGALHSRVSVEWEVRGDNGYNDIRVWIADWEDGSFSVTFDSRKFHEMDDEEASGI